MGINVKLQVFEGPLDLLLHLIDKNKVNIYDIPIVMITEQYMEYVDNMDKEDLDVVSEFLVMAATLLDIKSRMLLPKEVNEEGEEEDPRAELVEKLLEYKLFKYMSYELKDKQVDAQKAFYKEPTIPPEVEAYKPPINIEELIGDTTLARLNTIFQEVMKRKEEKIDPIRSKFGKIEKEKVSMADKYEASNRGIKIIELENAFQMCTKQELYEDLIKVAAAPRKYVLTDVLLETLSIIAYKQPITKIEIEKIRGVSCEHAVNKLVEYGLAKELGRLDAPGRPMLFGTTEEFLRAFGVTSIDELPVISEDIIEKFKDEAEMEIKADNADDYDENQLTLNI